MNQEQWDELKRLYSEASKDELVATLQDEGEPVQPDTWAIHGHDLSLEATLAQFWTGEHDNEANAKWFAAIHNAWPSILAEREATQRLRDAVRAYRQQLRIENVVDNLGGAACSACRDTGCAHCGDPINCGELKQMREPTREEWLAALKFLAAFDKESKND